MHIRPCQSRAGAALLLLAALLAACTASAPAARPTAVPAPPALGLPAAPTTLTRGPYLQDVTDHGVTVVWRTAAPAVGGVAVRSAAGGGAFQTRAEPAAARDHVLRIPDLQPATAYQYAVLADGGTLGPAYTFRTAPRPGAADPFTFTVWGDSGCGCPDQWAVAAQLNAAHADLALHTGDLIYEDGQAQAFDPRFFAPYSPTLATAPLYPVLGNHDVLTQDGAPWLHAFFLPGDSGGHTTRYYSFTYGNTHFVALDSEEDFGPTSAQYGWLVTDLASTAAQQATWRIAFFHRPPYSSGFGHGSSYDLREAWSPLFERFGVDLVFSGHEHNYERSLPRRDYAAAGGTHAVVYIVSGGGGKDLYNVGHQPWSAFSAMVPHYVRVSVAGAHLHLDAIGTDGRAFDQVDLAR